MGAYILISLEQIQAQNYGVAADLLRQAQQETEERYLSDETGE